MPAVEKVSTSGSLPQHEAQLLGRLLQGLEESSLSVHDVTSVLELDLKRPGYGDSLAQTMASPDREVPKEVAPRKEEEEEAPASAACARCRVLERQMKALAQALAGLGARVFNWTVQASLQESERAYVWDMTQQYLQPCAHLDGRIAEVCSSLSSALRRERDTVKEVPSRHASPQKQASSNPCPAAPVKGPAAAVDEVLVSFRATAEAMKLNGIYRRRTDIQANGRPVYCNGNRHILFMSDGAWVIKEGPSSEEGAYVYAYVEDALASEPFGVRRAWQVMDDRDGFVEEREGMVRRNLR